MIAPPYFTVPPEGYGGVEAVIADLVDALEARGHIVTLLGAGHHRTRASHFLSTYDIPPSDQLGEPLPELTHAAVAARLLDTLQVDVVHDHTLAGPLLARARAVPTVVTAHGPMHGEPGKYYQALGSDVCLVAISDAQRALAPMLPWVATVHNAVRVDTYPYRSEKERFVLFLGRFHPAKGPHLAIDAARAAGRPIVLAGKCSEPVEQRYFSREIEPRLGPDVTIFGVADGSAKRDLLSRASCLLFPVCWEEPFGLVMIEAMACGTPVVGFPRGAVPEVVVNGTTGILVPSPADLPAAIHRATLLDPAACRSHVQERFSTHLMAEGYEDTYRRVLEAGSMRPAP